MGGSKKKPYAEVVREMMEKSQAQKRLEEAEKLARERAEYERDYKKEKARLRNGGMRKLFEKKWKPQIDERGNCGGNEIIFDLQRNQGRSDALSAENKALYEVGFVFLEQEGFSLEFYSRFFDGTGGDDPYPDETLVGIKVKW